MIQEHAVKKSATTCYMNDINQALSKAIPVITNFVKIDVTTENTKKTKQKQKRRTGSALTHTQTAINAELQNYKVSPHRILHNRKNKM